ncbi:MAG: hypothetical protein H7246_07295 [Phycisphaerae bacterium]|nr:hypothetical protein [Saprospiraceae bacterium]
MHWKFDPFFSLEILHGKYPPPGPGKPAPPAPEFSVGPTSETQKRLLRMGWVFRPYITGGGGTVYAEKIVAPNGTAKLRVSPALNEGFTFLIRLPDLSFLNVTKPYSIIPSVLPPFSGRARLIYFDNLNAVALNTDTFSLPAGIAVGEDDFGSRMPSRFTFRPTQAGVSQIEMIEHAPAGSTKNFPIVSQSKSVEIVLPENGYTLKQQPSGSSEMIFLTDETLPSDSIGVVRIFQPSGADWEPFRRYQIMFET